MPDVFIMIREVLWVFRRKNKEKKCHLHIIIHTYVLVCIINMTSLLMLTLITWLKKYLSGFSIIKFFSLLFPYRTLWKEVTRLSPTHEEWSVMFYLHEGEVIYINYLKCFYKGDLSLHFPFLIYSISFYLFNHLFILVWTHGYIS